MSHVRKVKHSSRVRSARRHRRAAGGTPPRGSAAHGRSRAAWQTQEAPHSSRPLLFPAHHDRAPEKADQPRGDIARQLRAPIEHRENRDDDQPRPDHPVHARQIVSHKKFSFPVSHVPLSRVVAVRREKESVITS
nr:MAG TPA: hypothetical protein [Caudoviricetes sp.]